MKKKLLTAIITLICCLSYAQQQSEINLFDKGVNSLKAGNYKDAINKFSDVLSKTKDSGLQKFCHIYRAFSYNGLGDYKSSIADLDTAIIIDPSDIATYIDRGKTEGEANRIDEAKKDFEHVLTKDSASEQGQAAYFYLAQIYYDQNQFKESIRLYDKLIGMQSDDPEVYFNRGAAKGRLTPMDIEGSIKDYDKAIELNPNYKEAYANRGVMKINLLTTRGTIQPTKKQTADACSDLKKAKQLGDNEVDDMIFLYCDKAQ